MKRNKEELLAKIQGLVSEGVKRSEALRRVGVSPSTYSYWRNGQATKNPPSVIVHAPTPSASRKYNKRAKSDDKCVVVITPISELQNVIRQLQ